MCGGGAVLKAGLVDVVCVPGAVQEKMEPMVQGYNNYYLFTRWGNY